MAILNAHSDEIVLLVISALFLALSFVDGLKLLRRSLIAAMIAIGLSALLIAITKAVPRDEHLIANPSRVLAAAAVICWWIAGAIISSAILHYIVKRWIFPDKDQPRARKLFADLSAGLIYLIAGIGILNVIAGPSLPGMLATSGVAAVVLGLALQSTLGDLFSGLALNFERPFGAGEWVAIQNGPEGRIIEINWRATRLLTPSGDVVVIPNSNLAKAVVRNRSRPTQTHMSAIQLTLPQAAPPDRIREILLASTAQVPAVLKEPSPSVGLQTVSELGVVYELDFYVADYALAAAAKSAVLETIWHHAATAGIEFSTLREGFRINSTNEVLHEGSAIRRVG